MIKYYRLIFLIFFLVSACASPEKIKDRSLASFSFGESCKLIINNFFSPKKEYKLTKEEIEILFKELENWNQEEILSLHNRSELLFFHLFNESPPALKNFFLNFPTDAKKEESLMKQIRDYGKAPMLERFFIFLKRRNPLGELDFNKYLTMLEKKWKELPAFEIQKLEDEIRALSESARAYRRYEKNYFFNLSLKNPKEISIGNLNYEIKKKKDVYWILVPREKIKRPAWNPLTHAQSQKIYNNPQISAPESYEVSIGLDGNFYLLDGNHRFHLKENREMIWVKVSELKTASLRIFLDLVGVPQPSEKILLELDRGNISPQDLLPPLFQKKLMTEKFVVD